MLGWVQLMFIVSVLLGSVLSAPSSLFLSLLTTCAQYSLALGSQSEWMGMRCSSTQRIHITSNYEVYVCTHALNVCYCIIIVCIVMWQPWCPRILSPKSWTINHKNSIKVTVFYFLGFNMHVLPLRDIVLFVLTEHLSLILMSCLLQPRAVHL